MIAEERANFLGTESDILSESQAQRMVEVLPREELVAVPASDMRRLWWKWWCSLAFERFLGKQR